ncbi:sensor histidine kinase [Paenibacillus sp. TRM 82003]|nr:sensor histidine kinase [Paenibacillus sp. TRM 82003]
MRTIGNLSFRLKLNMAFLIITIMSILITGFFSYSITSNILERNALELTQDSVVKSAQSVDEKLGKLMLIMMTFMISEPFANMLEDVSAGEAGNYYTHLSNLDNVFSQARIAEPLIHSIYVSTPIGEFYPLTINRNRETVFQETDLYKRFQEEKRTVWIEGHEDPLFSGKTRVVSLILEAISGPAHPVKDVYVVVNIREEGLRKLVGADSESGFAQFLLSSDGKPVYAAVDPLVRQAVEDGAAGELATNAAAGYETYERKGEAYLLNYAKLSTTDWTVASVRSKDDVLSDLIYVQWMIVLITAASFFVTALLSQAFTGSLLKPLRGLQAVMRRVEANDLTARFVSTRQDELTQVGFRFNRMLEQIVVLIEEVKRAEASKRAAEIKSLSAQMDPHFLYNTLNTIYWKLKLNQVEPSQKMVVSLSRLFQLGLNKGKETTTLEKEIEHVRLYLDLQAFCYEELFEYDITLRPEELRQEPVPRLILQPLVENSILHGFRSMERGGRIAIEIDREEGASGWFIRVSDNGRGMEEAEVQALLSQHSQHGYAVGNLLSRLQLFYGGAARLELESAPERGTTVRIFIPLEGERSHG